MNPICFTQNTREELRAINGDGSVAGSLSAQPGTHQTNYIVNLRPPTPTSPQSCRSAPSAHRVFGVLPFVKIGRARDSS